MKVAAAAAAAAQGRPGSSQQQQQSSTPSPAAIAAATSSLLHQGLFSRGFAGAANGVNSIMNNATLMAALATSLPNSTLTSIPASSAASATSTLPTLLPTTSQPALQPHPKSITPSPIFPSSSSSSIPASTAGTTVKNPLQPYFSFDFPKTVEELTKLFSSPNVAAAAAAYAASITNNSNSSSNNMNSTGGKTGSLLTTNTSSTPTPSGSPSQTIGVPSPNVLTQAVLGLSKVHLAAAASPTPSAATIPTTTANSRLYRPLQTTTSMSTVPNTSQLQRPATPASITAGRPLYAATASLTTPLLVGYLQQQQQNMAMRPLQQTPLGLSSNNALYTKPLSTVRAPPTSLPYAAKTTSVTASASSTASTSASLPTVSTAVAPASSPASALASAPAPQTPLNGVSSLAPLPMVPAVTTTAALQAQQPGFVPNSQHLALPTVSLAPAPPASLPSQSVPLLQPQEPSPPTAQPQAQGLLQPLSIQSAVLTTTALPPSLSQAEQTRPTPATPPEEEEETDDGKSAAASTPNEEESMITMDDLLDTSLLTSAFDGSPSNDSSPPQGSTSRSDQRWRKIPIGAFRRRTERSRRVDSFHGAVRESARSWNETLAVGLVIPQSLPATTAAASTSSSINSNMLPDYEWDHLHPSDDMDLSHAGAQASAADSSQTLSTSARKAKRRKKK
ncbi:hypothetical protein DFJ77DRAFT_446984 [Powellomyces hirtus]|nr:hypothetical protein DFJ77DRAFT_446984 [Powellomyces hirtus]